MNKLEIESKILELESEINSIDFWSDRARSENVLKEISYLKFELNEEDELNNGDAILSIIPGAGGDDGEDWGYMLYRMYNKFFESKEWRVILQNSNFNDHGGIKNITLEVKGEGVFKYLKRENGVHRLVRISPFNSNAKRHTSFALVEVLPVIPENTPINIKNEDIEISFSKSGGPGGQNVNKRETAVRALYKPLNISVHVTSERSQEQNRDKAIEMLKSKVYLIEKDKKLEDSKKYNITSNTNIEWGNQIRNYVLHPYKLVKDLRSGYETSDIDKILSGDIEDLLISLVD